MKDTRPIPVVVRNIVGGLCALLLILFPGGGILFAQDPQYPQDPQYQGPPPDQGQYQGQPPQGAPQQGQVFSPEQLANLVAPIALYPDNLLGQVLAASTYP